MPFNLREFHFSCFPQMMLPKFFTPSYSDDRAGFIVHVLSSRDFQVSQGVVP